MGQSTQNRIKDGVEVFAQIFGQETQDIIIMLLQQLILAAVASVGVGIGKMLSAVQFDGQSRTAAEQIHFHSTPAIKGNRQFGIQPESSGGFRQCFQATV